MPFQMSSRKLTATIVCFEIFFVDLSSKIMDRFVIRRVRRFSLEFLGLMSLIFFRVWPLFTVRKKCGSHAFTESR
jgi:hypothetical protein